MNRKRKSDVNSCEETKCLKIKKMCIRKKVSNESKTRKAGIKPVKSKISGGRTDGSIILIDEDCELDKHYSSEREIVNNEEINGNDCDIDDSQFAQLTSLLSSASGVPHHVADNFVKLIEDENTLPFIARYRKSMVDHMTPESLQDLYECYVNLCAMRKKAISIIKTLKKNGKLTHDLEISIVAARSMSELDLLYQPFKERCGTLADRARKLGLEKAAYCILNGSFVNISSLCNTCVDGLKSVEEVETNLIHLLADIVYRDSRVVQKIKSLKEETIIHIESSKSSVKAKVKSLKRKEIDVNKYSLYFNFKMRIDYIKPHQILALNRGEAEKILAINIHIPNWFYNNLERFCLSIWKGPLISKAIFDAYKRMIKPWLSRRVRSELTAKAEKESINVFASNLKRLLMTSPIKGHTILGIDPGFSAGCKIGIITSSGDALDTCVIYPKFNANLSIDDEYVKLQRLIDIHKCEVIALGNGTACRETESWLKKWKVSTALPLVIVPEQGASIYSCSPEATKEHPGMDPNLISALSIARRALDPLSELIKVEPKHVGVGLYQHDIPPKLLNEALNNTIVNCASFVGADLNTASVTLLRKIAGLTETKAKAILKYREKNGSFKCRNELLKVTGIGPKIFKQCAGFLRVPQSSNKLDNTWIHPESYEIALKLLQAVKLRPEDIGSCNFLREFRTKTTCMGISSLSSKLNCPASDVELMIEALSQAPHEDPLRNNKPVYSMSINNINQLKLGSILTGVVSNVTPFGCFVDCGVGKDGLIHTSQMGGSRIPQLGERVKVMIIPPLTDKIKLKLEEIMS